MDFIDLICDYIKTEFKPKRIKYKGNFRKVIRINDVPYLSSNKNIIIEKISNDIYLVFGVKGDDIDQLIEHLII